LGNGTIFGFPIWGEALNLYLFILPPGAFIALGLLLGMFNSMGISRENKKKKAGAKK
jgi:electron transport complex protein RnfE